jgi:hypothetical protein
MDHAAPGPERPHGPALQLLPDELSSQLDEQRLQQILQASIQASLQQQVPAKSAEKDPYDPEIENWQYFWLGLAFFFGATTIVMFLAGWVACDVYAGRCSNPKKEAAPDGPVADAETARLLDTPLVILRAAVLLFIDPGMFTHAYGSLLERLLPANPSHRAPPGEGGRLARFVHPAAWALLPWGCELIAYAIFGRRGWTGCFPDAWRRFVAGRAEPDVLALVRHGVYAQAAVASWGLAVKLSPFWQINLSPAGLASAVLSSAVLWVVKTVLGTCWMAWLVRNMFLVLGAACTALWVLRFQGALLARRKSIWIVFASYLMVVYWVWSIPLERICAASRCSANVIEG